MICFGTEEILELNLAFVTSTSNVARRNNALARTQMILSSIPALFVCCYAFGFKEAHFAAMLKARMPACA